jgi:quercetin dioxygenase-like cupin family protein
MKVECWDTELDGPLTETALRRKLEKYGYEATRYVYPPGTRFDTHTHTVDKIDAVLSGRFRITMGEHSTILEAGAAVFVPRGEAHSAEVVSAEAVVSLDAVKI